MARILITVPPLTGHLNPALAVAAVLAQQGHILAWAVHARVLRDKLPPDARVYALDDALDDAGDEAASPDLASAGLAARGLESVRLFFEDYAIPLALRAFRPLDAAVRDFAPDLMLVDHQMLGGALVARQHALPWLALVTTSASILRFSPSMDAWVEAQYRSVQQLCLAPERIVARPDFSPYLNIVFSIEALLGDAHPRVDAPYAFVGPTRGQGRRAVEFPWAWLDPTRKKLLVTMGTVSRDRDTRFFEVVMQALAGLEVQAVLVGPEALAAIAPPNVLVRSYVPQLELLARVDGVICHGGHNTVCEALAQGLPLIVAPIRDDQPVIARQAIDTGAALFMRYGKVTVDTARRTIQTLLDDASHAQHAQRVAAAFASASGAEGAAAAVAVVLARAASASSPVQHAVH
jgi:MGT family glycosyltransferase